jgi:hypothetical protein
MLPVHGTLWVSQQPLELLRLFHQPLWLGATTEFQGFRTVAKWPKKTNKNKTKKGCVGWGYKKIALDGQNLITS